jgi:hypothetical protein
VHDIISDIIDWDEANKAYTAGEGQSGERYIQRLEATLRMAEIEDRWQHVPDGFHGQRNLIKTHIQAVAETTQVASREEMCWLAIAAAIAWLPKPESADAASLASVDQVDARTLASTRAANADELPCD